MDRTVSIIVPMFHGKRYLKSILKQIDQCAQNCNAAEIELILYNDSPDEEIQVNKTEYKYEIKVFNPEYNRGIHGARVQALSYAEGEYILFLDQDDKIFPAYLSKQLECIGNADAVVCRAIHNSRLHYTNTHVFETVISKEFMLKKWCPIVSPGQVLLRKSSIPLLWEKNILRNNGADDYFLWLLMAGEGKVFSLNQEILFEHVITGENMSCNTNTMMDSELEMLKLLKDNQVFQGKDAVWLSKLSESLRKVHIKELDNYKRTFIFLQQWNRNLANGHSPFDFFRNKSIQRIALYGAGDLGKNIELLLRNTDIKVAFYIDQNAEYILSDLPVYTKENICEDVDAILMTIEDNQLFNEIVALKKCPVYQIADIWKED